MSDWKEDVTIDPLALDVEWVRQARLFGEYAAQAAEARRDMERLKERRDVVVVELGLAIRRNPAEFGLEKLTEATVQAVITTHKQHQEVAAALAEAEYQLDMLNVAVRALDQKKTALENLVRLQGQNYFAGPSVPRDIGAEWVKNAERGTARAAVKRSLNRKEA